MYILCILLNQVTLLYSNVNGWSHANDIENVLDPRKSMLKAHYHNNNDNVDDDNDDHDVADNDNDNDNNNSLELS